MSQTRFEPNYEEFNRLATGQDALGILTAVAEEAFGIALSKTDSFEEPTGDYTSKFMISETTVGEAEGFDFEHAAVDLINYSDHAAAVEWGAAVERDSDGDVTLRRPAHHILARTLDEMTGASGA
jgi:hypothetical protein